MSDYNEDLLRRLEQNDEMILTLNNRNIGIDFDRLGRAISTNTNICFLEVHLDILNITGTGFYDGLKQNTSIYELAINGNDHSLVDSVGSQVLQAYQENSTNIIYLRMNNCYLQNGGDIEVATTLQCCTNLSQISLFSCNVSAVQLLPMVNAMKGLRSLKQLYLNDNDSDSFGDEGCLVLATLLEDPNCNLQILRLMGNSITNEGVVILVNSLANNTQLKELKLDRNPTDQSLVRDNFSRLVCNTTSINNTYLSNHTLEEAFLNGVQLVSIRELNSKFNKSHVAIVKILTYHPIIEVEPMFTLGSEDDERNLKALPYVIDWFDKAIIALSDEDAEDSSVSSGDRSESDNEKERYDEYHTKERKLSAIYEFVLAMPIQFVPPMPDMLLLHKGVRDQLEDEKTKLERQIDSMLKTKKDLEDRIETKDKTIEILEELSDSISNVKLDDKKRKRGN